MTSLVVSLLALFAQDAPAARAVVPAGDDALGGLGLEPDGRGARRLDFYGFADFSLFVPLMAKDNPWGYQLNQNSTFGVGALNAYVDAALTERVRSLIEVRFTYAPQGTPGPIVDGRQALANDTTRDPADYGKTLRWGGIYIERAWIEYQVHPLLTIRGGQFLTPYGIWNVDHGSPTVIGIRRPYIIGEQLFPEQQTGLELYGSLPVGPVKLGYHLTLSNGRGLVDQYHDLDANKALGGRLYAELRGPVTAVVGASGYIGRATTLSYRWTVVDGLPARDEVFDSQYDERALAADLRLELRGLLVQGEAIVQDRAFTDAGRPIIPGNPARLVPDGRRWGAYGLVGYRTPLLGIMPYVIAEYYRRYDPDETSYLYGRIPDVTVFYGGLNVRPVADIVLKAEFAYGISPDAVILSRHHDKLKVLQAQVAWAF